MMALDQLFNPFMTSFMQTAFSDTLFDLIFI